MQHVVEAAWTEWRAMGGVQVLAELGIVDPQAAQDSLGSAGSITGAYRLWELLNTEAWLRTQLSSQSA
jgi:hypothetical protein